MPEIISRKEARALGLKRYFTGKPCSRGHYRERTTSTGNCLECSRGRYRPVGKGSPLSNKEMNKRFYQKNRLKIRAARKKRIEDRNRDHPKLCRACGDRLTSTSGGRMYCSRECLKDSRRRKSRPCLYCGKAFRPFDSARIYYCSDACSKVVNKERRSRKYHTEYYNGPSNPTGEKQWLRKNQAMLRVLRRELRNRNRSDCDRQRS